VNAPAADPAERGRLDIEPAVLRKIVEFAADGTPGTLRNERRLAGIDVGETGAVARVAVGSATPGGPDDLTPVDVRLELTLQYPGPVREVVEAVRARVTAELARTAGFRVRALDVTVAGLRGTPAGPRLH
jgi:uncharacterized alkaline shock family protein YloU